MVGGICSKSSPKQRLLCLIFEFSCFQDKAKYEEKWIRPQWWSFAIIVSKSTVWWMEPSQNPPKTKTCMLDFQDFRGNVYIVVKWCPCAILEPSKLFRLFQAYCEHFGVYYIRPQCSCAFLNYASKYTRLCL